MISSPDSTPLVQKLVMNAPTRWSDEGMNVGSIPRMGSLVEVTRGAIATARRAVAARSVLGALLFLGLLEVEAVAYEPAAARPGAESSSAGVERPADAPKPILLAQRRRRRSSSSGALRRRAARARPAPPAKLQGPRGRRAQEAFPQEETSEEQSPAPPAAAPDGALQRGARVEFDGRLVQGQTAKSGAIYLFARRRSELRSMVLEREGYRQEILRTVYPRDEFKARVTE